MVRTGERMCVAFFFLELRKNGVMKVSPQTAVAACTIFIVGSFGFFFQRSFLLQAMLSWKHCVSTFFFV